MGVKIELSGLAGDISQSVQTLLRTPVGTLVYDREYGVELEGLDCPPEVAEALLIAELEEKLQRYEPRARLEDVSAVANPDGVITLRVVMTYADEADGAGGIT